MRQSIACGLLGLSLVGTLGLLGCQGRDSQTGAAAIAVERHPVRGMVLAVDAASGMVTLKHDAIPGFMEAMTMGYRLKDPSVASELHPQDVITATLENERDAAGPSHLRLTDIVVIAQGKPDYKPAVQYHVPEVGDVVPHFTLRNQDGKTVATDGFKGQVLLITFVYTRCPLPEFCIRMSRNFSQIDAQMTGKRSTLRGVHLLTVSFDPTFDTPPVLKAYGESYLAQKGDFRGWDFAVPTAEELPKMEQWFDLGVTAAEGGAIQHSVSTVVVDNTGRVRAFYPKNDWTVEQVLADAKKAGAQESGG